MIADVLAARDDISEMLARGWAGAAWPAPILSGAPAIRWEGREALSAPDASLPFAALTIKHAIGEQASLTDSLQLRRWNRAGVLTVQCFGSLISGMALEQAMTMAIIAQRVYQGNQSDNGVWFHGVAIKEAGPTNGWYQVNMTANFEYDELR